MTKWLSVGICGLAVLWLTAGFAGAQSTTREVKDKSAAAADQTGAYLSDTEITTAVKTKLLADKMVGGLKINVETEKGVVTLRGPVDSAAERSRAMTLARHTHGVTRVVDKLTIEKKSASSGVVDKSVDAVKGTSGTVAKDTEGAAKSTGRFLSDAEITSAVKTKLAADSGVHSLDVHVDTDKGIVTLTGEVRSDAEKANVARIARDTKGVKRVIDRMTVK